jgi:hypothetical protein
MICDLNCRLNSKSRAGPMAAATSIIICDSAENGSGG